MMLVVCCSGYQTVRPRTAEEWPISNNAGPSSWPRPPVARMIVPLSGSLQTGDSMTP